MYQKFNPVTIGERLTSIRESKGFTVSQASKLLNCSRATISNYESGYTSVTLEFLYRCCDVYEIELSRLLSDDENAVIDLSALNDKQKELILKMYDYFADLNRGLKSFL